MMEQSGCTAAVPIRGGWKMRSMRSVLAAISRSRRCISAKRPRKPSQWRASSISAAAWASTHWSCNGDLIILRSENIDAKMAEAARPRSDVSRLRAARRAAFRPRYQDARAALALRDHAVDQLRRASIRLGAGDKGEIRWRRL